MEPLQRALKETGTDAWINGRRRDHGAERASLPVWEGDKVNPLAFWTFEDCWTYLRKHNVRFVYVSLGSWCTWVRGVRFMCICVCWGLTGRGGPFNVHDK